MYLKRVLAVVDEFRTIALPEALSGLSSCPYVPQHPNHKTVVHSLPLASPCMVSYRPGGFLWLLSPTMFFNHMI